MEAAAAGLIGILVGLAELLTRYRDAPSRSVLTVPGAVYMGINALASGFAWFLIDVFDVDFGIEGQSAQDWTMVLVAGFGAMAFFRSSFFVLRIADQDVPLGLFAVLQALLESTDRAVDRTRAVGRDKDVGDLMAEIDFDKAYGALPTYCFALLQNLPDEDQRRFGADLRELVESNVDKRVKSRILGLLLINLVGHDVLSRAVTQLMPQIALDQPSDSDDGSPAP
jgi:hypothetical protein